MKIIKWTFIIAMLMLLLDSCNKYDFQTGIVGTVRFGSGDCMPPVSHLDSDYYPYTGKLYFIPKENVDINSPFNFEELISNSISVYVKDGKLTYGLTPGAYSVSPKDSIGYFEENTIEIVIDEILEKDFEFWQCTSY